MYDQGSWRDAYRQTLRRYRPPTGVKRQAWEVFVDSVITALTDIKPSDLSHPDFDFEAEYIEPEEFGYQGVIEGLNLLTTAQVQGSELDFIRTSFANSPHKTAVELWAYLLWIIERQAWDVGDLRLDAQGDLLRPVAPREAVRLTNWLSGACQLGDEDED